MSSLTTIRTAVVADSEISTGKGPWVLCRRTWIPATRMRVYAIGRWRSPDPYGEQDLQ